MAVLAVVVAGASSAAVTTVGPARTVVGSTGLEGIGCASPATCWAAGANAGQGVVVAIAGAVPGAARVVAGTSELDGVACSGATACWAVGQDASSRGVVVGINGGTVGGAQVVAGTELLTSTACGGVAACEAVGYNAAGEGVVVAVANGVPGPARVVPGTFELDGIACADAVSCEAVGSNSANRGVVVAIVNGIPGAAHVVAAAEVLDGVACPDASTCRGVGFSASRPQRGLVVSTGAGNPGMARIVPGTSTLRGVACRSAADCEAVGSSSSPVSSSGRVVPVTDGTPGAAQAIPASRDTRFPPPGETALRGVACVRSAPVCAAVGAGDDHSDSSLRGVLATITTPVAFSCGTIVTGSHAGTLVVRAGSTCLTSARLTGSVSVEPGAVLHVTSSTITGSITAHAPGGVRLCRAHVGRSVSVSGATGPVVIGDPGRGSCAGNWIGGSLRLSNNTHGVQARGNHLNGYSAAGP